MSALVPPSEVMLAVERREASTEMLATTTSAGLAFMLACGHFGVDARNTRPEVSAIGKTVMLATPEGRIVGCAKLTGVITLQGTVESNVEHPQAQKILAQLQGTPVNRRCLWVFENGVAFHPMVECEPVDEALWKVPEKHRNALREAYRAAKERDTK